MPNLGC